MPQKDDTLTHRQRQLQEALEQAEQLGAQNPDEGLARLHRAMRELVGLEGALVARLSTPDLVQLLVPAGYPDLERLLVCAELLYAESRLRREADPAARPLELYLAAFDREPSLAAAYADRLDALTPEGDAPPEVAARLASTYLNAGRFDRAENWLYRWGEAEPDAARGWAEGFYRDLLTRPDAALAAGGLPRTEVEEGLADITGARGEPVPTRASDG